MYWNYLLGRGIVDPNDDFRLSNPPVNGPLLEALATDFAKHKFDLKYLVRTIMNSRTYQLSAVPNDTNREDDINFSHAAVRSLQAEQLLDAISQVTAVPAKFEGYPLGTRQPVAGTAHCPARRSQGSGERKIPPAVRQAGAVAELRLRTQRRSDAGPGAAVTHRVAGESGGQ